MRRGLTMEIDPSNRGAAVLQHVFTMLAHMVHARHHEYRMGRLEAGLAGWERRPKTLPPFLTNSHLRTCNNLRMFEVL